MPIKVRAIKEGYYGRRRRPDRPNEAVFYIDSEDHLGSWMQVVDESEEVEEVGLDSLENEEVIDTEGGEAGDTNPMLTLDDQIINVLMDVDHDDDSLWTDNGLIRMNVVEDALNDKGIKRADIDSAWPGFCRNTSD